MEHLHFPFSPSISSDVDESAVEELLSQIIDEEVLRITTNPVGTACGLDPELEARYAKLRARGSNLRPPATCLETQKHQDSFSSDSNSTARGGSNWSPSERNSSRTFMASPSHRSRSTSPPPPKSCFCGSPTKLLKSLGPKKSRRSDSSRFGSGQKSHLMSFDKSSSMSKGNVVKDKYTSSLQDELDCLSDEELLTDLTSFSLKNQKKELKKAMQEEHKVNKDAEELVKWVKQASARMEVSVVDDDDEDFLSDDEGKRK
ncbi:uncharacterized protein LOC131066774 [Cryptomeria japonica]|uniref:uncharacterized protein LOC131066774 n=1 Tax=Cryptomeria japonica TaxID=3369 RepID=UPI0027DA9B39|nr:uncharacterized protein LOC131066774 [Cryptomeria japonica]